MSQRRIFRGFATTIPVSVLEKIDDVTKSYSIVGNTEIKACLQTLVLTKTAAQVVVNSAERGEFDILISAVQALGLTTGTGVIKGQIEFGTTQNPIVFQIPVRIEDPPC